MGQPVLPSPSVLGPANCIDVHTLVMCSYLLSWGGSNTHSIEQMSTHAVEATLYLNWVATDCLAA